MSAASVRDPLSRLGKGGVLLVFGARWCTPSLLAQPLLAAMAEDGVEVRDVDVDVWPQHAESFSVVSLPTFVWLEDGKERRRRIGATSAADLRKLARRR